MPCRRVSVQSWQLAAILALLSGVASSDLPSTCSECVSQEYSWQAGECHAEECPVTDVACYTTLAGCDDYEQDIARQVRCSASSVGTCAACLAADPECVWNKDSGSCFSGTGYWGPPAAVIRSGEVCPGAMPVPTPGQVVGGLTQRRGSKGGATGNLTGLDKSVSLKMPSNLSSNLSAIMEELPSTCGVCVVQGKTWQADECQAGNCPIEDVQCYRTITDCQDYEEAKRAQEKCEGRESCEECHTADPQCLWQLSSGTCFAGTDYMGPPDDVVSSIGICPHGEEEANERRLEHFV